jgi:hypothetical protein
VIYSVGSCYTKDIHHLMQFRLSCCHLRIICVHWYNINIFVIIYDISFFFYHFIILVDWFFIYWWCELLFSFVVTLWFTLLNKLVKKKILFSFFSYVIVNFHDKKLYWCEKCYFFNGIGRDDLIFLCSFFVVSLLLTLFFFLLGDIYVLI